MPTNATKVSAETLTDYWGNSRTVSQWRRRQHVGRIVQRFGDWCVTPYGLECLCWPYEISKEQLWQRDWAEHMQEKRWCDMVCFSEALAAARQYHRRHRPDAH
jgi:hypothetical protein